MARMGLWKVHSGAFAGWREGDKLYDAHGCHVGYFSGDVAFDNEGNYLGEIFRDDWIGRRPGVQHCTGTISCTLDSIVAAPLPNRTGLGISGWRDPDF